MKRLKKLFIFLLNFSPSFAQLDTQPRVNSVNGNLRFEPGNGKDILFNKDFAQVADDIERLNNLKTDSRKNINRSNDAKYNIDHSNRRRQQAALEPARAEQLSQPSRA